MESVDLLEQEPDNRKRVEMADSPEPPDADEDTTEGEEKPIKTLTQRMMAIRSECSGVGKESIKMKGVKKDGKAYEYDISAHTIEGVLHGVRTLFDKHGVWMLPNLVSREYSGNRCDVMMEFHFQNVDDPKDRMMMLYAGAGTDNSDKGFAKAGTNALKEMLKKVFLITDREDAKEEEDQVEYRSGEGVSREEADELSEQKRAALEQWAKAFKMAITKVDNLKDLKRLQSENKDQLIDPALKDVTRDFFVELIEKREAELKDAK